jgi:hypothetical protein
MLAFAGKMVAEVALLPQGMYLQPQKQYKTAPK